MTQNHTVFIIHSNRVQFKCSDGRFGSEPILQSDCCGALAEPGDFGYVCSRCKKDCNINLAAPQAFIRLMSGFLGGTHEVIRED